MPTDAQIEAEYQAYLRGDDTPPPANTASDRVEQRIRNTAKAKQPVEDVEYEASQTIENFPESAAQAGSDIAQMFMNPIDTAMNLGSLVKGGIDKGSRALANALPDSALTAFTPESGVYRSPEPWGNEPMADAVGQAMSDRYGGLNEIKTTAMEDPAGMALDVLGGTALVPGKLGRMAAKIDPMDLPFKAAGSLIDPAGMYKSAAKFPSRFDADAVTNTALSSRIMPTEAGQAKLEGLIRGAGDEVDALIDNSVAKGELIDVSNILKPVDELRAKTDTFKLTAADDLKKVDKIVQDFNDYVKKKGYDKVTATEVQKFKRDVYDKINWSKSKSTGSKAAADTRKAFAKGAKEELEAIIPEIKGVNLKQGDFIELADALQQPASRISRRDIGGLGMSVKTGAGNLVGDAIGGLMGEPQIGQAIGTTAGAIYGALDSPRIKARLAMELNAIKNSPMSNAQARVATLELLRNVASMEQDQ